MSTAYCCGDEGECPYIAYRKEQEEEQARQQQRELERQSRKENIHNEDVALSSVFYITGGGFANLSVDLCLFTAIVTQIDRGMSDLFYTLPPLFLAFSLCMVRLLSYPLFFGTRDRIQPYIGGLVAICSILIIIRCME